MLETQLLLNRSSQNLSSLLYTKFNQYFVEWINAAGSFTSTSMTYGKIFICYSKTDISHRCLHVSRNSIYIGFAMAIPVFIINSAPLILKKPLHKKRLKQIKNGVNLAIGILGNQTFYVLCLSAALSEILHTDNIDNNLFIGIIGIPSLITGIMTDTNVRYKLYHWFNLYRNIPQNLLTERNYCQKFLDALKATRGLTPN